MAAREPVEVICHNEFAPHTCVLRDDRVVGIIDFDYAAPGPRLWDAAFAGHLADGPHLQYLADADYIEQHRAAFDRTVSGP